MGFGGSYRHANLGAGVRSTLQNIRTFGSQFDGGQSANVAIEPRRASSLPPYQNPPAIDPLPRSGSGVTFPVGPQPPASALDPTLLIPAGILVFVLIVAMVASR